MVNNQIRHNSFRHCSASLHGRKSKKKKKNKSAFCLIAGLVMFFGDINDRVI